jgi:hypothetical protein
MRLSEKTIEINFCSQFAKSVGRTVVWFGLTQAQEARAGFDACTRLGGKLFLFQFKASAYVLKSGARRFQAKHAQLLKLKHNCGSSRSVFYVFPFIGSTAELQKNPSIINQSGLLDVTSIPNLAPPTTRRGTLRVNGAHYVDVVPYSATFHSEPVVARMISSESFIEQLLPDSPGLQMREGFEEFYKFSRLLGRRSVGAIIV